MEALFLRILSVILSALTVAFNGVATLFPAILPDEPIENTVTVCDAEDFDFDGKTAVVSDYVSWYVIANSDSKEFEKFDWKYFFTRNVALVKVTLPDPGSSISVESVSENGDVLEIEYIIESGEGVSSAVECPKIILVETSKNISLVNITKKDSSSETEKDPDPYEPEEPLVCNGFNYRLTEPDSFNENDFYLGKNKNFSSYESWQKYFTGADKNFSGYDEDYFAENGLIVTYLHIPYENKDYTICSISANSNNNVTVRCQVYDSAEKSPAKTVAIVIEVSKEHYGGRIEIIGFMDEAKVYDPEMYFKDYVKKDEHVEIISDYDTWEKYADTFYFLNDTYIIKGDFFDEKNIALISVMLPTRNYTVNVEPLVKNGNSVEVSYSVSESEYYDETETMVYYNLIVAEISKDVTQVNVTQTNFKNRFDDVDTSNFDIDSNGAPVIISDFDSWSAIVKNNIPVLEKYNEEYFENYSVVLIPETYSTWYEDIDMFKLYENGDTVEIMYGINGDFEGVGMPVSQDRTIIVEVTKNIKNVSVSRKDTENSYLQFRYSGPFSFDGDSVIISDYETFISCVTEEDEALAKYDEEYFENNSVAIFTVTTPNTDGIVNPYYIYEENGVLNFGYTINNISVFPMLGYRTVLVEISKDVTSIETTELE